MVVNDIILVNTSIQIIGVVFASVWAGSGHRHRSDSLGGVPAGHALGVGTQTGNASGTPKPEVSTMVFKDNCPGSKANEVETGMLEAGKIDGPTPSTDTK